MKLYNDEEIFLDFHVPTTSPYLNLYRSPPEFVQMNNANAANEKEGSNSSSFAASKKSNSASHDSSIVGILTELSSQVRVDDKTIIDKLISSNRHAHVVKASHVKAGSKLYKNTNLGIRHSSGHVTYDCEGFCHQHKNTAIFNDHGESGYSVLMSASNSIFAVHVQKWQKQRDIYLAQQKEANKNKSSKKSSGPGLAKSALAKFQTAGHGSNSAATKSQRAPFYGGNMEIKRIDAFFNEVIYDEAIDVSVHSALHIIIINFDCL